MKYEAPAFPRPAGPYVDGEGLANQDELGMSLREWYAGMALQGIIASRNIQSSACYKMDKEWVASEAFAFASAMIERLYNETKEK